ncbi:unnamed protein product [Heterobilharzia americana]|nr:unnamed protein product [Heterobilharzia americana]
MNFNRLEYINKSRKQIIKDIRLTVFGLNTERKQTEMTKLFCFILFVLLPFVVFGGNIYNDYRSVPNPHWSSPSQRQYDNNQQPQQYGASNGGKYNTHPSYPDYATYYNGDNNYDDNGYNNNNNNGHGNNFDYSNYQPAPYQYDQNNNGENYNSGDNGKPANNNQQEDSYNGEYTPVEKYEDSYQPKNTPYIPHNGYHGSDIPSFGTGSLSGSKHSHSHLDVRGRFVGVGHQDYGINYKSVTKFRKGGGFDIYGRKRQYLDYDTVGQVKQYGNKQMKAKFEVLGSLKGFPSF